MEVVHISSESFVCLSGWTRPWKLQHIECVSANARNSRSQSHVSTQQSTFVVLDDQLTARTPQRQMLWCTCVAVSATITWCGLKTINQWVQVHVCGFMCLDMTVSVCTSGQGCIILHILAGVREKRCSVAVTLIFSLFKLSRLICSQSSSSSFSCVSQLPYGPYSARLTIALVAWHNESEAAHE